MTIKASALTLLVMLAGCGSGTPADPATSAFEVPSIAPTIPPTVDDPQATAWLRSFAGRDADHDGFITTAENAAAADNAFDAIDKDQDGEISVDELDAARDALKLPDKPTALDVVAGADQDGDGKLTLAEWITQVGRDFKATDTNNDGKVSKSEWLARPSVTEVGIAPQADTPSTQPTP